MTMLDSRFQPINKVCRRENINNRTKPSNAPTKGNLMKKISDAKRNIRQLKNSIQQGSLDSILLRVCV